MSMSDSSKPTPAELNSSLDELVNWEQVALNLPKINSSVIGIIIKEKPSDVAGQKLALWTKWLNMYPEGTWEDVISTLRKANEIALAESLTQAHCKSSMPDAGSGIEKHTTPVEEQIVMSLNEMHEIFGDIAADVEIKCRSLVSLGELHLSDLTTRLRPEEDVYEISGITKVQTVEEFFDKVSKCWTFLDCKLLKIVTKKLPNATALLTRVEAYMKNVHVFMKHSTIESLKKKISPLIGQSILAHGEIMVVFKLQDAWDKKSMKLFDILVQTLFPLESHNKMKWYEIGPGSVCITLIAHKQISEYLIFTSKCKLVFMKLVGVFSLKISDTVVFDDDENKSFAFDESFLKASTVGNIDTLQFLLLIGVCIDYQNQEGKTALMIASKHGHKEIVKYLLSAKANVNNADNTAQSALISASENNDIAIAQLLLQAKANPNHQRNDGNTSLNIACYKEYEELAILLISFGADPLIKNSISDTPFLYSVRRNMLKIVKLISPNLPSSELSSALLIACRLGHPEIISCLLQLIDCTSKSFHLFCANGDLAQVAQEIVQFSSDVNSAIVLGITPLMIASSCGHVEVVECLIQAEADINSTDQDGYSPLAYAITGSKSIAVVQFFLQAGANTFIRVRDVTLLQMAKEKCQSDMTDLLLQYMALQLYNMFSSVVNKIQRDLNNDIKQNKVTLQEIVSKLQNHSQFRHINGITIASNCLELFSCLKPHYNFLSWKIISFLSDQLKEEGYFTFIEIFEEAVKLANFSSVLLLLPHEEEENSHPSGYSEMTLTLERAWDRKSLFNLRSLIAFLFSSTACVMSHLTVIHSSQTIVVKYRIPRSGELTETLKSIVSKKQVSVAILGIIEVIIAIDTESVFSASLNYTFTFESAAWYAAISSKKLSSDELVKLLKLLFKLGEVNPNIVVANRTPLRLCVSSGNLQAVNVLLQNGASPHIGDSDGECTPVMMASLMGHFEIAKTLTCADRTIVNEQTKSLGMTALIFASLEGHIEIVHLLLQKGSEPNMTGFKGETALMAASQNGNTEIVDLLLEAGADPNVFYSDGKTALTLASRGCHSKVVKLLLAHHADYTVSISVRGIPFDSFGYACYRGNKETVDVFLNDANLSPTSLSLGWYIACLFNKTHLIEYLVHSLSEILLEERQLIVACVKGNYVFSRFHKLSPDITFVHGVTLLMIACSCGHSSIVKSLVNAGANVHQTDSFGFQAIDYCKNDSPMHRLLGIQWNEETVKKHFDKEDIFQDFFLQHKKGFDGFEMPVQYQSSLAY